MKETTMDEKGPKFNFHAYPQLNAMIDEIMALRPSLQFKTAVVVEAVMLFRDKLRRENKAERRSRPRGEA